MKVKSRQYSGRPSSSSIAALFLDHRFFQDAGPAQTSWAIVLREEMVRVEEGDEGSRRGFMRSVK
jgi:hypothetical protein